MGASPLNCTACVVVTLTTIPARLYSRALLRDQRMIEVSIITVDRARVMRRSSTH